MQHLGISGGGTKITGLYGAAKELIQGHGYAPKVISGISAGAILSLPIALKKWTAIDRILDHLTLKTFFSHPPVKANGKLTLGAYWRLIRGKHYLGQQSALRDQLAAVISQEEYYHWCDRAGTQLPAVIVGTVDRRTGARHYWDLRFYHYDAALDFICASAAIPVFTKGVFHHHMHLYDGGLRDHNPSAWVLEHSHWADAITEHVSIYSRPKDYRLQDKPIQPSNALAVLQDYIDITNVEISKMDERMEVMLCEQKGIKYRQYFLPSIMESVYDTDPERLKALYAAGVAAITA